MDLEQEEFGPFLKPNDTPIYVDAGSNHPQKVIDNAAPVYQAALERSGHQFKLSYEENLCTSDNSNKQTQEIHHLV